MLHSYLGSIGFKEIKSMQDVKVLLEWIIKQGGSKIETRIGEHSYTEIIFYTTAHSGIRIWGEVSQNQQLDIFGYFPFVDGDSFMEKEDVLVDYHITGESFGGWSDDSRLGVSLIFHLVNPGEYFQNEGIIGTYRKRHLLSLSGLCKEGSILLPMTKNEAEKELMRQTSRKRSRLLEEAKQGNPDAMENLTMDDMDLYSMISTRIQEEDVFSIVDSYFMPYGMECELYSILGDIRQCQWEQNIITKEWICYMKVEVNDILLDIAAHQKDIMGEVKEGRRFKGIIWLQGSIRNLR